MMFYGKLLSDQISPGIESLEVALLTRDEIPWDEIAFPVISHCLKLFFEEGAHSDKVHQARFNRLANREVEIQTEI